MRHVVFDFDGTLVDSAPGILSALEKAFRACGVKPSASLTASLIGPPLGEIIAVLAPDQPATVRSALARSFMLHYDGDDCLNAKPFQGVQEMIEILCERGIPLSIVTNKRYSPARRILDHLGWSQTFHPVYTLDSLMPRVNDKGALLGRLLKDLALEASGCAYVGDRDEDAAAAALHHVRFFRAAWGFGSEDMVGSFPPFVRLVAPDDLMLWL